MKYSIRTQHIELSDVSKRLVEKKIDRLQKYVRVPYVMDISLVGENFKNSNEAVTCKVTIQEGGHTYHTERVAENAQNALDQAIDALRNEIQKKHDQMSVRTSGL